MSLTVTNLIDYILPFDGASFEEWCRENGQNPEQILEYSANFGTALHDACLLDKRTLLIEELGIDKNKFQKAIDNWFDFYYSHNVRIIKAEFPIIYKKNGKALYHGRCDSIMSINGIKAIVELKSWRAWNDESISYQKPSYDKLKKSNIQTYFYENSQKKTYPRFTINVNHLGWSLHEHKKDPVKEFDQCIEFAEKYYESINF